MHLDVQNYFEFGPTCYICTPVAHFYSPLVSLPITKVPFKRTCKDLVGPKSARGHLYIFEGLDYATHYGEAVLLRNTASKNIAQEQFYKFSRTGILIEILTDQDKQFKAYV